ncbi:hypothetical protein FNV43_RR22751 [Rhamnella rubrinervis]|uniref:Pentatricopeptide repeat-containing protein n=1 Tax=Rhamnella rubrinervis TaxID=2594499 RepID=A0A8K0DXP1_9ROSA|nr:hypothetical protein FNV43_RR22751 [Rhamnella rubrinervis]
MKLDGAIPKIETCNDMLSLFLRVNRLETAWVLYAEMFKLRIKSSVYTFNIMINVLCKEGKSKKAKEFSGFMENLGVKLNVVTYNTLIHGYYTSGKLEGAHMIFNVMKCKGVEPDSYTYSSLISGMCKEGRLEEAKDSHTQRQKKQFKTCYNHHHKSRIATRDLQSTARSSINRSIFRLSSM